jgi:CBS domain-containing protein
VDDIAGFLASHPPFDAVDADELARIAAVTETEVSARGKAIFPQGAGPVEFVWVVRSGSVEVVHDGRVLDLLGPGELFGHASMISGLPTGFEARAGEDTVCYRIPSYVIRPLLVRPDVLRFVARSIVAGTVPIGSAEPVSDPVQSRVAALIRMPPLVCQGSEPIREAARRMTEQGASAVLVPLGGPFGIVTDRDLRTRVIAAGLSPDGPVSAIMTAPAYTVTADRLGGDVLLDMLERNVHHIPVLSAAGEVLGMVDDGDLVAAEGRKPLLLRRAIALAESQADLAAAAAGLGPVVIALHDARVAAEHVAAVRSVVLDALTPRRSPGSRWAAWPGGKPCRPPTWTARSRGKVRMVPQPDTWPGWPARWTTGCGPAGCRPTRTARARPTRCSRGRCRPGRRPRGAWPRIRLRRRR